MRAWFNYLRGTPVPDKKANSPWTAEEITAFREAKNEIWHAAIFQDDGCIGESLDKATRRFGGEMEDTDDSDSNSGHDGESHNKHQNAYHLVNLCRMLTEDELEHLEIFGEPESTQYSLLFIAIHRKSFNDVRYLLQRCEIQLDLQSGSQMLTPLCQAIGKREHKIVNDMLTCLFDTVPSQYIDKGDAQGNTPLHKVVFNYLRDEGEAFRNDKNTFELLLLHGANINALNNSLQTPLHSLVSWCIWRYNDQMHEGIQKLLDNRAEVNTRDMWGKRVRGILID